MREHISIRPDHSELCDVVAVQEYEQTDAGCVEERAEALCRASSTSGRIHV